MTFHCSQCNGQAAALAVLRHVGAKESVQQLWSLAKEAAIKGMNKCPVCEVRMKEVALPIGGSSPLLLDVCTTCQFVWLDSGEMEKFPPAPPKAVPTEKQLSPEAAEAIATAMVRMAGQKAEFEEHIERKMTPDCWYTLTMTISKLS